MSDSRTTSAASRTQQDDQNAMDAAVARAKAPMPPWPAGNGVLAPVADAPAEAQPDAGGNIFQELLNKVARIEARQAAPQVQPMELRTFDELERWAERAARTEMVPKSYKGKPDDIILAVQMGAELGLRPMQSLQNIACVNGRPSVWGDAMLALCMGHPLYAGIEEHVAGEGDDRTAVCVAHRKGDAPKKTSFSVAEAKRAGLFRNEIWLKYTDRMLQMRARGFSLRDAFPDKLRGLISTEEASDYAYNSAAPSFEAAIASQQPDASPKPKEPAQPDPAMVTFTDATCKLFAGVKTTQAREKLALEIADNLDVLRKEAPDLAKRILDAAQAAIERLQPQQQPKPAQAAQQAPQPADEPFEAWPCDDIGEPVGEEPITTPQAFAEWFEAAAERTANIEALRENNMDAIGEAGREPAAARMISDAIAAAVKRLAKRDSERGDLREETEALDAMTDAEPSLIMPIPMTPGGKFNGPKYIKDAAAEITKLDSLGAIDGWEAANLPSYAASPATKLGVDKALDARRVELGADPAPAVDKLLEQDERLADDMLEELRPMKTPAEGDRWKARMTNQTIMARWKNDPTRHRLFHLVNDAFQKLYQNA